jgi:hypothetical protein
METSRGFQPGTGASAITFVLMVGGAVLGAGIYHSQRDHVRWILAHRAESREDLVLEAANDAVLVPSSE